MLLIILLKLVMLWGAAPNVESSEMTFDIILKDKTVGELKAVRTTDGTKTTYLSKTNIRTRFITEIKVDYTTRVVFKSGVMQEADVDILLNGRTFTDTETRFVNGKYEFLKSGKVKKTLDDPIVFSSIMLIFEEPVGWNSAYSEESGGFFSIKQAKGNVYEKSNSQGRTSVYEYREQVLENMNLDAGIVKFEMVLKK